MVLDPVEENEILYGCPECHTKSMLLRRDVDGTLRFYCQECGNVQNRGAISELSPLGGVRTVDHGA